MILFVIEGERRESELLTTVCRLFFSGNNSQRVVFLYCGNLYNLYRDVRRVSDDGIPYTTLGLLRERAFKLRQPAELIGVAESDVSEIYLFFDYDLHHTDVNKTLTIDEKNDEVSEMLEFFSDETGNGKLFVSYPMIEALRYTKKLPDENFLSYRIALSDIGEFKRLSAEFSYYPDLKFAMLDERDESSRFKEVVANWQMLIIQHVGKANELCNGERGVPKDVESVSQRKIFVAQLLMQSLPPPFTTVLCSLPLFVFEYFGPKLLSGDKLSINDVPSGG